MYSIYPRSGQVALNAVRGRQKSFGRRTCMAAYFLCVNVLYVGIVLHDRIGCNLNLVQHNKMIQYHVMNMTEYEYDYDVGMI